MGGIRINAATQVTLFRVVLVPIFLLLTVSEGVPTRLAATLLFLVASYSDWIDGRMARARDEVTALGQLLDPVADKLLMGTALIVLVSWNEVSAWVAALLIGREVWVSGVRAAAAAKGVIIPAGKLGKWKMATQAIAIPFLLIPNVLYVWVFGNIVLLIAVVLSALSAYEYTVDGIRLGVINNPGKD